MSQKPPARAKARRFRILAMSLGIAIGIAAAEAALRIFHSPAEELVFLNKDGSIDWDCYCSNPRGYFVERKGPSGETIYCVDHTNEPARVVNLAAPEVAGHFKVLTVGDSFTYGLGVKVTDNYPNVLARTLESETGRPTAVSNHANVGRMVAEIHEELAQALAQAVPDVCIYGFVLNDPLDATASRTQPVAPAEKPTGMDSANIDDFINVRTRNLDQLRLESPGAWLRDRSRIVDLAFRQWEWRQIHAHTLAYYRDLFDPSKNGEGLHVTWTSIAGMQQLVTVAERRFLIVLFPLFIDVEDDYPFADIHEALRTQLTSMGIEILDLLSVYRSHRSEELWVHPLDRHPNELAHRLAGEAIAEHLIRLGWAQRTKP